MGNLDKGANIVATSKVHQKMIDEVMDSFDFGKVASVMEFLGWKWGDCDGSKATVPDERTIRKEARRIMAQVIKDNQGECDGESCVACGGLMVLFKDGHNGYLRLSFEVADYEVNACEL